jgi:hypothetical protein
MQSNERSGWMNEKTTGKSTYPHKCSKYYTKEDDGLNKDWAGEIVFVNPPYGKSIGKWVEKCYKENLKGTTIVMLIPARTDTSWFHNYLKIFKESPEYKYYLLGVAQGLYAIYKVMSEYAGEINNYDWLK